MSNFSSELLRKDKANGIVINYDQQGTGEPLILIPYLAADYACYAFQVAECAKHFTCISVDLRCAGESDKPEGPYTPELYASRPEYIDALAAFVRGRLVQPLDACMRQSQAVLAHDAQSQLGRIQAPTHPSMSKWRSLTGRRGRFCSGTPGRGSWLFSIIADQHQAADKGAYLQLAAWDPGIWSLVSQSWFVIIICSGIADAGILHETTQLRLWDQQRTPG